MTLCKKGGGVRKKSHIECINKSDISLGEGVGQNSCLFSTVVKFDLIQCLNLNRRAAHSGGALVHKNCHYILTN